MPGPSTLAANYVTMHTTNLGVRSSNLFGRASKIRHFLHWYVSWNSGQETAKRDCELGTNRRGSSALLSRTITGGSHCQLFFGAYLATTATGSSGSPQLILMSPPRNTRRNARLRADARGRAASVRQNGYGSRPAIAPWPPYARPFALLGQLVSELHYDLVVRLLLPIRIRRVELEVDADEVVGMPTNFVSSRKMGMTVPLATRGMKISRSNVGQILSECRLSRMQTT